MKSWSPPLNWFIKSLSIPVSILIRITGTCWSQISFYQEKACFHRMNDLTNWSPRCCFLRQCNVSLRFTFCKVIHLIGFPSWEIRMLSVPNAVAVSVWFPLLCLKSGLNITFLDCFRYKRLTFLQETELQKTTDASMEDERKSDELQAVERSILNHRELLRQVTSYPNRKLKQPDFLPYDPADSPTDTGALLPPDPTSSLSTSGRSEHSLKPLEELCNAYFLSLMKEQLADTGRRLHGDRSYIRTNQVIHSLSRRLKLTNFLFELWSPGDLDEEEAESADVEPRGVSGSKTGDEGVQLEPQSIESFFSCVEEIPIKLEAGEAGTATPDLSAAAELTGSVSSGDSIEVLGTEKSYRTQQVVVGPDKRGTFSFLLALKQI